MRHSKPEMRIRCSPQCRFENRTWQGGLKPVSTSLSHFPYVDLDLNLDVDLDLDVLVCC